MVRNGDKKGLCKRSINKFLNSISDEPMIKKKKWGKLSDTCFLNLELRIN